MPFAFRPLPGSSNAVTDAADADLEALASANQAEHHDRWDFNSTPILYIYAPNTPLGEWLNVLGAWPTRNSTRPTHASAIIL